MTFTATNRGQADTQMWGMTTATSAKAQIDAAGEDAQIPGTAAGAWLARRLSTTAENESWDSAGGLDCSSHETRKPLAPYLDGSIGDAFWSC
jgi:hypothetical protein